MKKLFALVFLLAAFASVSASAETSLTTDFLDGSGKKIGTGTLQEMENGTLISIDVSLPTGVHAIHIHQNSECTPPDFKTAGSHFNPENMKHGYMSKDGFHAGDLPNLYVESTGHIRADIFSQRLHLSGKNGLNNGASIIIHEKADDYSSDPSGNAGGRIACAVIKK